MKNYLGVLLAILAFHASGDPHIGDSSETLTHEINIYSALQAKDLEFKKTYLRYVRARATNNSEVEASLVKSLKSLHQEMVAAIRKNPEFSSLKGPILRGGHDGDELNVDFIKGMPESAAHRKWQETLTANMEKQVNAVQGVLLNANRIQTEHRVAIENQKRHQADLAPGFVMIEHYTTLLSKHRLDVPVE